ncbi:TPA: transposase [Citrobacter freundii]
MQLSTGIEEPEDILPSAKRRTKQPNQLSFDVRPLLWKITGADLTQIHGFGPYLALKFVAECGTDMNRWPDASHFTSWLCLSPGNKIKCCPRKHGVHPVESLQHSGWQPQQLVGAIPGWALSIVGYHHV